MYEALFNVSEAGPAIPPFTESKMTDYSSFGHWSFDSTNYGTSNVIEDSINQAHGKVVGQGVKYVEGHDGEVAIEFSGGHAVIINTFQAHWRLLQNITIAAIAMRKYVEIVT